MLAIWMSSQRLRLHFIQCCHEEERERGDEGGREGEKGRSKERKLVFLIPSIFTHSTYSHMTIIGLFPVLIWTLLTLSLKSSREKEEGSCPFFGQLL